MEDSFMHLSGQRKTSTQNITRVRLSAVCPKFWWAAFKICVIVLLVCSAIVLFTVILTLRDQLYFSKHLFSEVLYELTFEHNLLKFVWTCGLSLIMFSACCTNSLEPGTYWTLLADFHPKLLIAVLAVEAYFSFLQTKFICV